jgi:hypothetical protein
MRPLCPASPSTSVWLGLLLGCSHGDLPPPQDQVLVQGPPARYKAPSSNAWRPRYPQFMHMTHLHYVKDRMHSLFLAI